MFPEKCSLGVKLQENFTLTSELNYGEGREVSLFNSFETKYCSFFIPTYDTQKLLYKSEIFKWLNTLEKIYFGLEGTSGMM